MEIKKTEKASLENKRLLFVEMGLVCSLLITWGAFSWSSKEEQVSLLEVGPQELIEEEIIPITQETPPPPPEVAKVPVLSDIIDIVDDDIEVEDNIIDLEEDNSTIDFIDYIEGVEDEEIEEEEIPFMLVEEKPSFMGGDPSKFSKWVGEHLQYPDIAKENGVQGRVMLQFTIGSDGSLTNIKVIRGVDPSLDKEAVRVVQSSPKWKPGKQRDRAVKVTYTFPVVFQLR